MPNDRPDTEAARIVEDGLHLLKSDGRYVAARFLLEHGARMRVIGRGLRFGGRVQKGKLAQT